MPFAQHGKLSPPAPFVIAIGSGKGGVGKSTVSVNLALALAQSGAAVGLLDADFHGPNVPLMVGLKRERWMESWTMASRSKEPPIPPMERYGLKIMSAGFLIGEDQPMILDGQTLPFLMKQLVQQVSWGNLDYFLIDLPPGTADVQQMLVEMLRPTGAVVVVTPQDVAHLDGKKAVQLFRRSGIPLLGVIENMSAFRCPHCDQPIEVFAPVPPSRAIWSLDVEKLGTIPLDPAMSQAGDRGVPLLVAAPESPQATAFRNIAYQVKERLTHPG